MPLSEAVLEMPKPIRGKYRKGGIRQLSPDRFQISFYDQQGIRRRQSFSTYDKAKDELDTALKLRDKGKLDPVENRVTIDSLAASYQTYVQNSKPKSASWVEIVWRCHLEPFFGGKVAGRITTDHLEAYIHARLEAKACSSTVNREMTVIRAILRKGASCNPPKIARVPNFPAKLREPEPRKGFVNDQQYAVLVSNCKWPWLRVVLAIAYNFGFRRSELVGLRVSQIDFEAKPPRMRLFPGTTKSDKGRSVVLTTELYNLLSEVCKGKQGEDYVLTRADGRHVVDFRKAWRGLVKAAGMPGLLLHDFRRAAIRNMMRGGISKTVAKKISGHATDSVFDRYDITDEQDLIDAAQKMEARTNGHKLGTLVHVGN